MWCVVLVASACGRGDSGRAPTAPTQVVPLASFTIGQISPIPGQSTDGTVTLAEEAPIGGTTVTIHAADSQVVSVTPRVTLNIGERSATVPIFTRRVLADTNVTVTASAGGVTRAATLSLGAGSFLSFASPAGDRIGQGRAQRMTSADFGFNVTLSSSLDEITLEAGARTGAGTWRLHFSTPSGQELRSGSEYPGAARPSSTNPGPGLEFRGFGATCDTVRGEFSILEVAYGPGPSVERLHAQFTQSCDFGPFLRGELYLER